MNICFTDRSGGDSELRPVKWTVKQKTRQEQENSGDQQKSPEFFFEKGMANSTLLSSGQGLRKWPAATLDRLPSVCLKAVKEDQINLPA